jgi:hypothetical protein
MRSGARYQLIADAHAHAGSVLFTVTDDAGRAVGEARLIAAETWQLTSFEVRPPRNATVAAALCHGIVQTLRVNRAQRFIATVDEPAREFLTVAGLLPAAGSVAAMLDRQRRVNPEGYRLVTQGHGLGDVELPYPAELLTAPIAAPALAS